jgi:hypothetical protein
MVMSFVYRAAPPNDCYGDAERIGLALHFRRLAAAQPLTPSRSRIHLDRPLANGTDLGAPENAAFLSDICRCLTSLYVFGANRRTRNPKTLAIVARALLTAVDLLLEWDCAARDFSALDRGGDAYVFHRIMESDRSLGHKEIILRHIRFLWLQSPYLMNAPSREPYAPQWERHLFDTPAPTPVVSDPFDLEGALEIALIALWCVRAASAVLATGKAVRRGRGVGPLLDRCLKDRFGIRLGDAIDAALVFLFLRGLLRPLELITLTPTCARAFRLSSGAVGVIDATTFKAVRSFSGRAVVLHASPQVQEVVRFLAALTPSGAGRLATACRASRIVAANERHPARSLGRFIKRWGLAVPLPLTATRLRKTGVAWLLAQGTTGRSIQRQLCHAPGSAAFVRSYRRFSIGDTRRRKCERAVPLTEKYRFPRYGMLPV